MKKIGGCVQRKKGALFLYIFCRHNGMSFIKLKRKNGYILLYCSVYVKKTRNSFVNFKLLKVKSFGIIFMEKLRVALTVTTEHVKSVVKKSAVLLRNSVCGGCKDSGRCRELKGSCPKHMP